ncbi:MAG: hypothetical protein QOK25_2800 [Thermoleophilaceae bacterium]|nr:hypothetical protein [Thermoleophilaceae bacterium]
MRLKRLMLAVATPVALAISAAPAGAATTVGQIGTPTGACGVGTYVQAGTAPGSADYTLPDGVITSWMIHSNSASGRIKLKVLRRGGSPSSFTVISSDGPRNPFNNAIRTYPARVPVHSGDLLGMSVISGTFGCQFPTGSGQDVVRNGATADPAPGSTVSLSGTTASRRVDIAANVEPDADRDGFGDQTQDGCPSDPTTQGSCRADVALSASTDRNVVRGGQLLTYFVTFRNFSPSNRLTDGSFTWSLPSNVELVQARIPQGTCSAVGAPPAPDFTRLSCDLGSVEARGRITVAFVTRALSAGRALASGTASLRGATDPYLPNNSARAQATVLSASRGRCRNLFVGTSLADAITGTVGGDLIIGLGGNDRLVGLSGDDCLSGGAGNDRLSGGPGRDRLNGGSGKDTITGGSGRDRISGGSGNDTIYAIDGARDVIDCGSGRDVVFADRQDRVKHCEVRFRAG